MPHSDDMPRVVLMCGVSGSGKTWYASALEKKGYVRLSPDEIAWSRYGAELSCMPFGRQQEVFAEVSASLSARLAELIDSGSPVVVDSTLCRRAKRDAMRELCRSRGIEPQLVFMNAPLTLLKKRLSMRLGSGPDDQIVPESLLEMFFSNFERPAPDENFITIDQRHFSA